MRESGLEREITHDEIAGTLIHAEHEPSDLEQAYRHFTGPGIGPDNSEMLGRVGRLYELWSPKTDSTKLGTANALRKAREFVRAQEKWKHPYYWAAWVLWGLGD